MATTEEITFPGSTGARLAGVLHAPEEAATGSILLAHCFTCGKDIHTMMRLARGLAEAGYACLRFDFTGLGESGGEFTESTVTAQVKDLTRAATTLIERGYGPCGMLGHSLGGAATLLAAHRVHTVRSVAVVGAPASATHVRHLFSEAEDVIRREGCEVVEIAGRPFPISSDFLDDLEAHADVGVADLGRPLLVLHAPGDEVVAVEQGERIFAAAAQPKAFVPLLGGDHLVSDRGHAESLLAAVTTWFDHTL